MRRDYVRAHTTLMQAHAKDPNNPYLLSNLEMLEKARRRGKGVQQK